VSRVHLGAYGLLIDGLDDQAQAMQAVPAGCRTLRIRLDVGLGDEDEEPSDVTADGATLRLLGGGRLRMDRADATARYSFDGPRDTADLLHPFLAPAAALVQIWAGHEAFHAGAFVHGGGAVLLVGNKEDGKSTTLAWIAAKHGLPVIADDLAVITQGSVHAGPRLIDVRADSAIDPETLGGGVLVRDRARRRVPLAPAPAVSPVAAVVLLRWASEPKPRLTRTPISERLPALISQRMFYRQLAIDETALLALTATPTWTLHRPRGLAGLTAGVQLLLDQLS
jgi:hypothetical protein